MSDMSDSREKPTRRLRKNIPKQKPLQPQRFVHDL